MPHSPIRFLLAFALFIPCFLLPAKVNFEDDVLPLLQDYCMDCHGPEKKKSGFRVDRRVYLLKGGDSGFPAVIAGDLKKSYILELIKSKNPEERMPPKGDAMFDDEIALLEQWIEEGAVWPRPGKGEPLGAVIPDPDGRVRQRQPRGIVADLDAEEPVVAHALARRAVVAADERVGKHEERVARRDGHRDVRVRARPLLEACGVWVVSLRAEQGVEFWQRPRGARDVQGHR